MFSPLRNLGIAGFLCSASAAVAQSASPQTAPSPWSLHDAVGAPGELKLSASFRIRSDHIVGQARPGFNASDDTVNLRTTLFAEYDAGPVRFGAELYDSRAYFADARTPVGSNEVNSFELVQAYVALDLDAPFGAGSKAVVQAGRFVVNLGSRRLVAADDYRNTTNSYSGLRGEMSLPGGIRATLLYVLPIARLPDDLPSVLGNRFALDREGFDAVLWGGIASKARAIGHATAEATVLRFVERDRTGRPTRDRALTTLGGRVFRESAIGKIDFEVEGFYQFGTISSSTAPGAATLDVSATFFHADVGYTFAAPWRPRVSLRFDRASGDGPGATFGRFDTLFGMRRAELAPSGLYNSVGRANLSSPALRLELVPSGRSDVCVNYRPLWLASRTDAFSTSGVRDQSGGAGNFAGHQIEARVRHWIVQDALRFEANALLLLKGRFLKAAPNATGPGNTRYLSLNMIAFF